MASEASVIGGSIEDATGDAARPIYDFDLVERVAAFVKAVREVRDGGFAWVRDMLPTKELNSIFGD